MSLIGLYQKAQRVQWRLWGIALSAFLGGVLGTKACQMAFGEEPQSIAEYRLEMFGREINDNILVWSISEGKSNAQGDYEITGKIRTYAWHPGSKAIVHDGVPHELPEEWRDHLSAMMLHVALDLYRSSTLEIEPQETTPARIECAE